MSKKPSLIRDIGESLVMATEISGEFYGYAVTDEGITAEEYDDNGDIVATYTVEITVRSNKESK